MDEASLLVAIGGTIIVLPLAALLLVLMLGVPWQAYRRGHGFLSWFLMQIVALNPVYPMILLSLLPDKAKAKLRLQFAAELDERLGERKETGTVGSDVKGNLLQSVGDMPTAGPSIGAAATAGFSSGSAGGAASAPPSASIGDAETRLPGSGPTYHSLPTIPSPRSTSSRN